MEEERYRECMRVLRDFVRKRENMSPKYFETMLLDRELGEIGEEERRILDCVDVTKKYWTVRMGITPQKQYLYDKHRNFSRLLGKIDEDKSQRCYRWENI